MKLSPPSRRKGKSGKGRISEAVWLVTLMIMIVVTWRGIHIRLSSDNLRSCSVNWKTIEQDAANHALKIGMISLAGKPKVSGIQGQRDFGGFMELTWENKASYAKAHNYDYINGSDLLDQSRPPAWSKILAMKHYLHKYDWIMWMDSDTVIMNHEVELESFISVSSPLGPDLLLTEDAGGANAGVWFLRNTSWSEAFLDKWWSMDSYIRKAGDTKSGDNDAMKALLREMKRDEFSQRVRIAPQCAFNSYIWKSSIRNWLRFLRDPKVVDQGLYKPGDFILHLAGVDNKVLYIKNLLDKQSN